MKKLIIITGLAVASLTSYGQGFFGGFGTAVKGAWDGFTTPGISKLGTTVDIAFLYGTGAPLIAGVQSSVATNTTSASASYTPQTAWTAILTDPNFHLATNSADSSLVALTVNANGSSSYQSGATFGVAGTAAQTYNVYVIGWNAAYANPYLASAAGSAVGWSSVFSYSAQSSIGTPTGFVASGLTPFGVSGSVAVVPEPTTLALAGLSGASLLLFRRRK